jgi:hypothetical protein
MKSIEVAAVQMQWQLQQRDQLNIKQLENSTEQSINLAIAFKRLSVLKQTISYLDDLTIRQVIEEGCQC